MSRLAWHVLAGVVVIAVVAASCADHVEVGRDEAIELLVIDGVPRDKAVCIVDQVSLDVDLARVTGVDPDITDRELAVLAAATAGCRIIDLDQPTVLDPDDPTVAGELSEGGTLEGAVDERVDDLIMGGLAPSVARCVGEAILASADPATAVMSDTYVGEAIRVCDR